MRPRPFLALLALAVWSAPAPASPPVVDGVATVRLTLTPAPPAKPLSRTYLLPEFAEQIPGNAVQMFLRSFMEQDALFGREESERRQAIYEAPATDPKVKAAYEYAGGLIDRDLFRAGRMSRADWQVDEIMRQDGYNTLLPDVQKMRQTAQVLAVRARGEVAMGKVDAAIKTLRTLFALGRTFNEHPTLIGQLVGVAVNTIGLNVVEELIQQPGCPNLYWAMVDLPTPLVDTRRAAHGERGMMQGYYEKLLNRPAPLTEAELDALTREIDSFTDFSSRDTTMERLGSAFTRSKVRYKLKALDPDFLAAARERLKAAGEAPARVDALPPLQLVIADDYTDYRVANDESLKGFNLPYHQALPLWQQQESAAAARETRNAGILGSGLIGSVAKIRAATARLEYHQGLLTHAEAVRLYAAEHGGQAPPALDAIKLPLPLDPVTGKPYGYAVNGGTVTLRSTADKSQHGNYLRVYEITLRPVK